MLDPLPLSSKRHLLTIGLEDYFHVGAFNKVIQHGQWYRFETRLEGNTRRTLELLDQFGVKATFFVLGWVADTVPEIVREVAERGHEVANRGYYHRSIRQMTPAEFREDLLRSQEALERASGNSVHGYRVAHQWFALSDVWALDILAEQGYTYDSSMAPFFSSYKTEPECRFVHQRRVGHKTLWEFPLSTWNCLGWGIPIAGGNYFRQFPHPVLKRAVAHWHRKYAAPFVMYFHVWELDPDQPRINTASLLNRIRHYRNLNKMVAILADYIKRYRFVSIADYLGLEMRHGVQTTSTEHDPGVVQRTTSQPITVDAALQPLYKLDGNLKENRPIPVSIVVPCFNEELILPYLANTLRSVKVALATMYDVHCIFVDDRSTDGTWDALRNIFAAWPNCTVLRHTQNLGVAAAILTGLRHATTEVVCSIDCDCTYDPHELRQMVPLLKEGVDLVTASPYHPQGGVRNVPPWRLWLSKAASLLYRLVLRQKLSTYTSCFRVYRRSAVANVNLREVGFLGITEMVGQLDLQGARIVEYPTTLEGRMLGRSKMKVLRTIAGHVKLLVRLLVARLRQRRRGTARRGQVAPKEVRWTSVKRF